MSQLDLVFEGGGAKGTAFAGALEALASAGHTHRRLIGTSAGAITATLVGAGYSPAEMLQACTETLPGTSTPVFSTFLDAPKMEDISDTEIDNSQTMELLKAAQMPVLGAMEHRLLRLLLGLELYRELFSFNECGGFYMGNAFLTWFRGKLQQKGIPPDIRWRDFAAKTGSDVSVVTSDVSEQEMVVLNARTAPDCPVAFSVRMSMSIPMVWEEVIWQADWGRYCGRDKANHIFVDGGVLSNFPLALVAESGPEVTALMGDTDPNAAGTLGLLLDETIPVAGAQQSDTRRPRLRTADRVSRLIDAMTGSADAAVIRQYPELICHIPVGGYGTTEFRMSPERMALLVQSGREAMARYLNRAAAGAMA